MNKILEGMMIYEILDMYPQLEEVLIENGLNCVGCPGASNETLREAAEGHGIDFEKLKTDIEKVLE